MSRRRCSAQPWLVEVVAVEVRHVQVVGRLDAGEQVVVEAVVAGEREPRPEERGDEPRVAHDRAVFGLDEDPGVAERRRSHHRPYTYRDAPVPPRRAITRRAGRCTADRRGTRARSTPNRPSSAARSEVPGRRTTRPARRASPAPAPARSVSVWQRPTSCRRQVSRCRRSTSWCLVRPAARAGGAAAALRGVRPAGRLARRGCRDRGRADVALERSGGRARLGRRSPQERRDVVARRDDGDDVPPLARLLGELGGQRRGLERRDADGVELVHGCDDNNPPIHLVTRVSTSAAPCGPSNATAPSRSATRRWAAATVPSSWVATTIAAPRRCARSSNSSSALRPARSRPDERLVDEQQLERADEGERRSPPSGAARG